MNKSHLKNDPISIRGGLPARYPVTSISEIKAVKAFESLVDPVYIKSDIKTLDKNPNYDGVIELTDGNQVPIGKIEVQIKTLDKKNSQTPRYQCSREFLSYCDQVNVPVLLILVDIKENRAFWLHINEKVIDEAEQKIKGASCVIHIPLENVVDGIDKGYIETWTNIIREYAARIRNYENLKEHHRKIENELIEFRKNLVLPLTITQNQVKVLQIFVDQINGLLDYEFKTIKSVSYPDYWKIGVALIKYASDKCTFYLFPLPYGSNEPLIKQINTEVVIDPLNYFRNQQALIFIDTSTSHLEDQPLEFAYDIFKSEVLKIIKKTHLPVKNNLLANEYLVSFIDTFHALLGFEHNLQTYSLNELDFTLNQILPVALESRYRYIAEGLGQHYESLDSHKNKESSPFYFSQIENAKLLLIENYQPRTKTVLYSQLFSVNLVNDYINYLQVQGKQQVERVYLPGQTKLLNAPLVRSGWNTSILVENLKIFFANFILIHHQYLSENFVYLKERIDVFNDADLMIFVLYQLNGQEPHLECYGLKGLSKKNTGLRFFFAGDPLNPIKREAWINETERYLKFEECDYYIRILRAVPLDFMFDVSPTYAFIKSLMEPALQRIFMEHRLII